MKKVLVIAYAFPPMAYAGVYRTLRFCKYLPQFDWQPLVLTIKTHPYHQKDYSLMQQLSKNVKIYRTFTIDPAMQHMVRAKKHKTKGSNTSGISKKYNIKKNQLNMLLSKINFTKIKLGRFLFNLCSFPDHMVFWIPFAVIKGIKIIFQERPDVIYTSSPPHSSHLTGLMLAKLFKKPWVSDFRDPWVDNVYFEQVISNKYKKIICYLEALVMKNATKVLLNTDSNKDLVLGRYRFLNRDKFQTLTNGFDPDDVRGLPPKCEDKFTVTYIGTLYWYFKTELFLEGLRVWIEETAPKKVFNSFQLLFVGSKSTDVERMIQDQKLSTIVKFIDFVPKRKAMEICAASHLLLLLLGFNKESKRILPSKLFDYFLCQKSILAIAPEGEVAKLIRESRTGYVVSEDNPRLIAQIIDREYKRFIEKGEVLYSPDRSVIERYGSHFLNKRLADIFDEIRQN